VAAATAGGRGQGRPRRRPRSRRGDLHPRRADAGRRRCSPSRSPPPPADRRPTAGWPPADRRRAAGLDRRRALAGRLRGRDSRAPDDLEFQGL